MQETNKGWRCQAFHALSARDVYDILKLRAEVFVVEQECAYLDPDGHDERAWHWLCRERGELLAYQRCLAPGAIYAEASAIGRIVVAASARGRNLGRELVERGIRFNLSRWPRRRVRIGAQARLQAFYESLGFSACSEPYLEDGIRHLEMELAAPRSKIGVTTSAKALAMRSRTRFAKS